jgi:hypothetical protein
MGRLEGGVGLEARTGPSPCTVTCPNRLRACVPTLSAHDTHTTQAGRDRLPEFGCIFTQRAGRIGHGRHGRPRAGSGGSQVVEPRPMRDDGRTILEIRPRLARTDSDASSWLFPMALEVSRRGSAVSPVRGPSPRPEGHATPLAAGLSIKLEQGGRCGGFQCSICCPESPDPTLPRAGSRNPASWAWSGACGLDFISHPASSYVLIRGVPGSPQRS